MARQFRLLNGSRLALPPKDPPDPLHASPARLPFQSERQQAPLPPACAPLTHPRSHIGIGKSSDRFEHKCNLRAIWRMREIETRGDFPPAHFPGPNGRALSRLTQETIDVGSIYRQRIKDIVNEWDSRDWRMCVEWTFRWNIAPTHFRQGHDARRELSYRHGIQAHMECNLHGHEFANAAEFWPRCSRGGSPCIRRRRCCPRYDG